MIKKFLLLLLIFNLTPQTSSAAAPQELNLSRLNTSQLEDIYQYYDYKGVRGYLMLPGYHYPPIYLSSFRQTLIALRTNKSVLRCSSKYWRRWPCALTDKRWNNVRLSNKSNKTLIKTMSLALKKAVLSKNGCRI